MTNARLGLKVDHTRFQVVDAIWGLGPKEDGQKNQIRSSANISLDEFCVIEMEKMNKFHGGTRYVQVSIPVSIPCTCTAYAPENARLLHIRPRSPARPRPVSKSQSFPLSLTKKRVQCSDGRPHPLARFAIPTLSRPRTPLPPPLPITALNRWGSRVTCPPMPIPPRPPSPMVMRRPAFKTGAARGLKTFPWKRFSRSDRTMRRA